MVYREKFTEGSVAGLISFLREIYRVLKFFKGFIEIAVLELNLYFLS